MSDQYVLGRHSLSSTRTGALLASHEYKTETIKVESTIISMAGNPRYNLRPAVLTATKDKASLKVADVTTGTAI